MSERLRDIVTASLIAAMAVTLIALVATDPSEQDRAQSIGERIRCPVCQGEPIAHSPSEMARDMMDLIEERLSAGIGDQEIIDELLFSYSGAVLLDPPPSGSTLLLWIAPILALTIGVGVIVWWRRHPTKERSTGEESADRPRARRLAALIALAGAFAVIVVVAGAFLQDRAGPASGVADLSGQDLEDVSTETMEAVIEANAENPQIDGMRLALAERYYGEGDYRSAFPHYLAVAESPDASDSQAVTALIRLGWMAWEGNAEAETAVSLLDQALAIDANSDTARYLKAQVLWCGASRPEEAAGLLEEVLDDPGLAADSRQMVQSDLDAIESGATCA